MSDEGRLVAGRYRLLQRLGSGAMGVVWQAHDERLHRTVAVKQLLLQPGLSEEDTNEAIQRAMREGRIAARLQHPNAIAVFDVVEENGAPCLVMEYLPSRSLAAVMAERGPLPPTEVARIGSHVAAALAAAHTAGIIHRDIKPGNILLGDDGTVKITDFGISRASGDVTVTKTGMLAGTPAYLAPEVARGKDIGPASDVFSLGSTLYAAVEGEPPFGLNDNTLALLHAVAAGRINPPRNAGPLTPLLLHLLQPEPGDRPTMAQTRDALTAIANGQPIPWATTTPTQAVPTTQLPHNTPPSAQGPEHTRLAARSTTPESTAAWDARAAWDEDDDTSWASPQAPQRPPARPRTRPAPAGRPAARPTARPAGSGKPWYQRRGAAYAAALVIAVVLGITLANSLFGGNGSNTAGPETTQSAPPTSTSAVAVLDRSDPLSVVQHYYEAYVVTGRIPEADGLFTTRMKAIVSKDSGGYLSDLNGATIEILDGPRQMNGAVAMVVQVTRGDKVEYRRYLHRMVNQGGDWLIDNYEWKGVQADEAAELKKARQGQQ